MQKKNLEHKNNVEQIYSHNYLQACMSFSQPTMSQAWIYMSNPKGPHCV